MPARARGRRRGRTVPGRGGCYGPRMGGPQTDARRVAADLLRAALAGLAFGALAWFWFSRFHLEDGFTAPDWFDYCSGVISLLEDEARLWPLKRSQAAGAPAAWAAARLGIVDGLLLSAAIGAGLMGSMLYLWGAALGGPRAGIATTALALTLGPVVLQARSLTFYPWVTAGLLAAGAGASAAVRWPGIGTMLAAGAGCGLALLMDVRALIWVLPALGIALLAAALREGRGHMRVLRMVALLVPIWASHQVGYRAFPGASYSLEQQVDVRALHARMGSQDPALQPPYEYPSRYVWGRQDPIELPRTLGFLGSQATLTPPADATALTDPELIAAHVTPWMRVSVVVLPLAGLLLARRRWRLLAFGATALPWVLALGRMPEMVNLYPRFLTQGLPVLALAGGVGLGALAGWSATWVRPRWRWPVGLALLAALVFGALPTPLSPAASWRAPWAPELLEYHEVAEVARGRMDARRVPEPAARCAAALQSGPASGTSDYSRWLDVSDERADEYRTRNTPVPPPLAGGIH